MRPVRADGSACPRHATSISELTVRAECRSGGDGRVLEMLVRRTVVPTGKRRTLTRLALSRGRVAAGDSAIEEAGFDLLLDERGRRADALLHGPGDLRLRRDREVAPDVSEERPVRPCKVMRIVGEPGHRALALDEYRASIPELIVP